jgi:hypothetical protein
VVVVPVVVPVVVVPVVEPVVVEPVVEGGWVVGPAVVGGRGEEHGPPLLAPASTKVPSGIPSMLTSTEPESDRSLSE